MAQPRNQSQSKVEDDIISVIKRGYYVSFFSEVLVISHDPSPMPPTTFKECKFKLIIGFVSNNGDSKAEFEFVYRDSIIHLINEIKALYYPNQSTPYHY